MNGPSGANSPIGPLVEIIHGAAAADGNMDRRRRPAQWGQGARMTRRRGNGRESGRTTEREGVGWTMGLEPTTTGITIRDSTN